MVRIAVLAVLVPHGIFYCSAIKNAMWPYRPRLESEAMPTEWAYAVKNSVKRYFLLYNNKNVAYTLAMTSISTRASLGSRATSTAEREG